MLLERKVTVTQFKSMQNDKNVYVGLSVVDS